MYKPKIIIFSFLFLMMTFLLTSCSNLEEHDIITTMYPQYDIAMAIAGDELKVKQLTPFGTEVHGYEPTAKEIVMIKNSRLLIYTSDELEPYVDNFTNNDINVLDLSKQYVREDYSNTNLISDNIHYWTDPLVMVSLVEIIRDEIIKVDIDNESIYVENALNYINEIMNVHNDLEVLFNENLNKEIFFYGHNAMTNFANRYNLKITALSENFTPDAELTPQQIIALKNSIKENNAKYLFTEELIDLTHANNLVNELKNEGYELELLELHGFHNISKNQAESGVRLVDLLKENFEHLKKAVS